MIGISLEIAIACFEAVKTEVELRHIKEQAAKNNPLNQTVSDISAKVVLKLSGTNLVRANDPFELRANNWIMLLEDETNSPSLNLGRIDTLMAEEVLPFVSQTYPDNIAVAHGYVMKYVENPLGFFDFTNRPTKEFRPIASYLLKKVRVLRISPGFIPKDTKVIGGDVSLTINGTLRAKFEIFPQGMDKTFLEWNPDFKTLVFLATNSIP